MSRFFVMGHTAGWMAKPLVESCPEAPLTLDLRRPLDISMDRDGILYISEGGVDGLSPRISLMDKRGQVVARWDSLSAHGSWVDAHGDIYLALGTRERVDKYVLQN